MSEVTRPDEPVPSHFAPVASADVAAVSSRAHTDVERLLESIIALAADAVVSTDESRRIIIFNPAAERVFGYRRDEVLGEPIEILLPRSARNARLEGFRATTAESERAEHGRVWGRRKSGELFPAESSISKVTVGGTTYVTAVLRDVTRERRSEKERAALLARTRAARTAAEAAERRMAFLADVGETLHSSLATEETFDALLHLIVPELAICCVIDVREPTGHVRRGHVVHGEPSKQEMARRLAAYPKGRTRYLTRRAIEEGESELVATVSDDFLRSLAESDDHLAILRGLELASLITVPLRAHGRVLGALALARGPGAAPYTQADLSLAQALAQRAASALDNARLYDEARRAVRARDDVLGVVSHDLRTPLGVISMCATALLGDGFADEARDRETLETVRSAAHWGQRLIQDLLDVSAINAGGLSLTRRREDPRTLVRRAILLHGELATERRIDLVDALTDELPAIEVDGDRIVQALGNLIANAVKFTPPGGSVRVGAVDEGERVRLYVADSGPGIPAEEAPHVFDRFWTAPRGVGARGAGMGLAIVRGVVEAHGGRVWLEPATPGRGATFSLALPTTPARAG